jgi:hypothetical protein
MTAKETVTWTDANGVTHTRRVKKANKLLHGLAFVATGGASGAVSAAKVAADAAYNAGTRQRIAKDMRSAPTPPPVSIHGCCELVSAGGGQWR